MNLYVCVLVLLPISCLGSVTLGFGAVAGLASLYAGWRYTACYFGMCCRESWNGKDFADMTKDLGTRLYGQHIAEEILLRHLKSHYLDPNPKKALVLSLHGTTGSGKNYITNIAISHLLVNGMKNKHIKIWTAKHHFSNQEKLEEYKTDLQKVIRENVKECPRSIFVFDETNDLPAGLLDVLKPMMDEYEELGGVDYRKSTFFFLSNTGATRINKVLLESKMNNKARTELKLSDFQPLIQDGSFNEKGGLMKSKLIEKNLIDSYVPFLPMEKEHIKMCIRFYLQNKKCPLDHEFINKIADMVSYEPKGFEYFSAYGCRGIDNLIKQEIEHSCIYNPSKVDL